MKCLKLTATLAFLCIPVLSFAHGSHGSGFMAGFTHPILGIDHNLAIVGTGILGYIFEKKKWYLYPLSFIALMIIGGVLGIDHDGSEIIEYAIVGSVFLIGLALGFNIEISRPVALLILTVFGMTHGYAHGAEMPETTTAVKYIFGYAGGAVVLSLVGFIIGKLIDRKIAAVQYQILIGGILIGSALMMLVR